MGSGNVPNRSTTLLSSAMQTNRAAAAATIFSRVRAAPPPLDQITGPGGFIRAIDIHAQIIDVVQVQHRNSAVAQPLRRGVGTGNSGSNAVAVRNERFNEQIDGGTGADTDDRARRSRNPVRPGPPIASLRHLQQTLGTSRNDYARFRGHSLSKTSSTRQLITRPPS